MRNEIDYIENEYWVNVYNNINYQVSNMGRVRKVHTTPEGVIEFELQNQWTTFAGSLCKMVRLQIRGRVYRNESVGKLVFFSFVFAADIRKYSIIHYFNNDALDNRIENLFCYNLSTKKVLKYENKPCKNRRTGNKIL